MTTINQDLLARVICPDAVDSLIESVSEVLTDDRPDEEFDDLLYILIWLYRVRRAL